MSFKSPQQETVTCLARLKNLPRLKNYLLNFFYISLLSQIIFLSPLYSLSPIKLLPSLSVNLNEPDFSVDDDGDGFSNLSEYLDGSDHLDASSTPPPPSVESAQVLNLDKLEDVIVGRVLFADASGVLNASPAGNACGYIDWQLTQLEDGQAQVDFVFNLHAFRYAPAANLSNPDLITAEDGYSQSILVQVTDNLGQSATYEVLEVSKFSKTEAPAAYPLNEEQSVDLLAPVVRILHPIPGQTVGESIQIEAVACDENGVGEVSVADFNEDDFSESPLTVKTDEGYNELGLIRLGTANFPEGLGDLVKFRADLLSDFLGEGPRELQIRARDSEETIGRDSVDLIVDTANPIKILTPVPNSFIQDTLVLVALFDTSVDFDLKAFYVEAVTTQAEPKVPLVQLSGLLIDDNPEADAITAKVVQFTGFAQDIAFEVHLAAVDGQGNKITRSIPLEMGSHPRINRYEVLGSGPEACLEQGQVWVDWSISNGDEVDLSNGVQSRHYEGEANQNRSDRIGCGQAIELRALRNGTNFFGAPTPYDTETSLSLAPIELSLRQSSGELLRQSNIPYDLVSGGIPGVQNIQLADPIAGSAGSAHLTLQVLNPGLDDQGEPIILPEVNDLSGRIYVGIRGDNGQIVDHFVQDFNIDPLNLPPDSVLDGDPSYIELMDETAPEGYSLDPRRDYQILRVELLNAEDQVTSRVNLHDIPEGVELEETGDQADDSDLEDSSAYALTTVDQGLVAWYRFLGEGDTYNWSMGGVGPGDYDLSFSGEGGFDLLGGNPAIYLEGTGTLVGDNGSETIHGAADALTVEMVVSVEDWPVELKTLETNTPAAAQSCLHSIEDPVTYDMNGTPVGTEYGLCSLDTTDCVCDPGFVNCTCDNMLCHNVGPYDCSDCSADIDGALDCNTCSDVPDVAPIHELGCGVPAEDISYASVLGPVRAALPFIMGKESEIAAGIVPAFAPQHEDDTPPMRWQSALGMGIDCTTSLAPLMDLDDASVILSPSLNSTDNRQLNTALNIQSNLDAGTDRNYYFALVLSAPGGDLGLTHYANQTQQFFNILNSHSLNTCDSQLRFNGLDGLGIDHNFDGYLEEVTIYNRPLEIQELRQTCLDHLSPAECPPFIIAPPIP